MLSNMNDNLFHIFKSQTFTFCLVCKEDILYSSGISIENQILHHSRSASHQESIRSLFKTCIPDPLCDSLNKQCVDIVSRSVYDITVLRGNKQSYIYQNENHYVCLMCKMNVSRVNCPCEVVKQNIVYHLESECHSTNVKDVCWFYGLKAENIFLLFHKSVLYCSMCNGTYKCRENNLLQTTICHLQTDKHNRTQTPDFTSNKNIILKEEWAGKENMHVVCPQCGEMVKMFNEYSMQVHFQKHSDEPSATKNLSFDCKDFAVCSFCTERVPLNGNSKLFSHKCKLFQETHKNTLSGDLSNYDMCFNGEETQNVIKIFGYEGLNLPVIKNNFKFVEVIGDNCFCILCWIQLSHPKRDPMLTTFLKHFEHIKHQKNILISISSSEMYENKIRCKRCKIMKIIKKISHKNYQQQKKKQKKEKIKQNSNAQNLETKEKEKYKQNIKERREAKMKEMRKARIKEMRKARKKNIKKTMRKEMSKAIKNEMRKARNKIKCEQKKKEIRKLREKTKE